MVILSELFCLVSLASCFHTYKTRYSSLHLHRIFPSCMRNCHCRHTEVKGNSFAFSSFANSALISSHSFHSEPREVFSQFRQRLTELLVISISLIFTLFSQLRITFSRWWVTYTLLERVGHPVGISRFFFNSLWPICVISCLQVCHWVSTLIL